MNDLNQLYYPTFFWGLVVVASFLGYGRLLCNAMGWEKDGSLGWGLQAVIGMAGVLIVGGLLMVLSAATSTNLFWLTLVGAITWLFTTIQDSFQGKIRFAGSDFLKNTPFWILVALYYAAAVAWIKEIDPNDDLPGYFVFPFAIQQTGTLLEPFSFRRACMFGGHPLLQAITTLFGSEKNFQFVDIGIGKLLLFGVLSHFLREVRKSQYFVYFAVMAVALTLHFPRINATSSQLHVVFALALGVLLTNKNWSLSAPKISDALLPALLIASASTFRPQMAFLGGCVFALSAIFTAGRESWKEWSVSILKVGSLSFSLLIPWMILLWKASGTPFLPPFLGNANPVFLSIHSVTGGFFEKAAASAAALMIPELLAMGALVVLLIVFQRSAVTLAFSVAIPATLLIFAWSWNAIPPPYFYRYTVPFVFLWWTWMMCTATLQLVADSRKNKGFVSRQAFAWGLAFAAAFLMQWQPAIAGLRGFASSIPEQIRNAQPLFPKQNYRYYREMQSLVPAGEPILVMVDTPYMFDHKRNPILNIEAVGQASPWGGLPLFQGPDALKQYLVSNGVRYVAFVHSESAMMYYNRNYWENNPWVKQGYSFIAWYGKYVNDFSLSLEHLSDWSKVLLQTKDHTLMRLPDSTNKP